MTCVSLSAGHCIADIRDQSVGLKNPYYSGLIQAPLESQMAQFKLLYGVSSSVKFKVNTVYYFIYRLNLAYD